MLRRFLGLVLAALIAFPAAAADIGSRRTLLSGGKIAPVWSCNFLTGVFCNGLTYTKSGSIPATLFDSTGKLTYQGNNLQLYSGDLTNGAVWVSSNGSTALSGGSAPEWNGTWNVYTENNSGGVAHLIYNSAGITAQANTNVTLSAYLKAGTRRYVNLEARGNTNSVGITVDTQNWTLNTYTVGTATVLGSSLVQISTGVYRVSVTGSTTNIGTAVVPAISGSTTSTAGASGVNTTYTGNSSTIITGGVQLETVTYETSPRAYIPTTSGIVFAPRLDTNPSTLAPAGMLIEEQRINIALQSNALANAVWPNGTATVTAGAATAPDGTSNAVSIADTAVPSQHVISQAIASVSGTVYTTSFFAKAGTGRYITITSFDNAAAGARYAVFDLSTGSVTQSGTVGTGSTYTTSGAVNIGNGWWRIYVTGSNTAAGNSTYHQLCTSNAGTYTPDIVGRNSYIGSGLIWYAWGAQVEAGVFATSLIPTTSATVTRTADVVQFAGVPLAALKGAQGALLAETLLNQNDTTTYQGIVSVNSADVAVMLYWRQTPKNGATYGPATLFTSNSVDLTQVQREGVTWSAAGRALSAAGGAIAKDTTLITSGEAFTTAYLGQNNGSNYLNGWVRSAAIWNQRLPDAKLKSLSTVGASYFAANDNGFPRYAENDNLPIIWNRRAM